MIVAFCGHREVFETERVRTWLETAVESLCLAGAEEFWFGGYGAFDHMALSVVRRVQTQFPKIRCVLVRAYPDRPVETSAYDETIYPPIETCPYRYAILRRNVWIAEHTDVLLAYVQHDWGGAAELLAHAVRRGKRCVIYPDCPTESSVI